MQIRVERNQERIDSIKEILADTQSTYLLAVSLVGHIHPRDMQFYNMNTRYIAQLGTELLLEQAVHRFELLAGRFEVPGLLNFTGIEFSVGSGMYLPTDNRKISVVPMGQVERFF